jgi:DNA invertase Pin-like site-specific DNA recombinase
VFGDMDVDTSTAVGKMQLSMFASVAPFERDRISERTREALAIKRAQGVHGGFSHGVLLLTRSIMSQLAPYTFSAITGAMKARRSTVRR